MRRVTGRIRQKMAVRQLHSSGIKGSHGKLAEKHRLPSASMSEDSTPHAAPDAESDSAQTTPTLANQSAAQPPQATFNPLTDGEFRGAHCRRFSSLSAADGLQNLRPLSQTS